MGMWSHVWNAVDMATRKLFLAKEYRLLQQFYNLFALVTSVGCTHDKA